ncbi:unnamed protein product [Rotaria sordida]|uniref:Uncharacterized protein n=2 Tax=Rotaria sordida TaxID=392033 RepID=A0A815U2R9_9BILA|nr:unnamed protein product [Rotaria sordida]
MLNLYILFLIIQQIILIKNSQTWYEYIKNIHIYKIGKSFQSNLQLVFGKRWYLILFNPLISSQPYGDGMSYDINIMETNPISTKRI